MDPAAVWVWASGDEGRTWEKLSEVDNPAWSQERYACTLCRLPDDTLLMPVESRLAGYANPPPLVPRSLTTVWGATYVHRSTDGGRTWGGPTGPYAEPAFVDTHWVGPNTGPGFMVAESGEQMIARMASGRLLAVIRYHGGPGPAMAPDQRRPAYDLTRRSSWRTRRTKARYLEELASADERALPVPRLRRRPQRRLSGRDARSSVSARDSKAIGP